MSDWREQAACRGAAADLFFPDHEDGKSGTASHAKKVCWTQCPVREECLEHALEHKERWGIWGGMAPRDRARINRMRTAYPLSKRCTVCKRVRPQERFNEAEPGRLRGDCKDCQQAYRKAYDERRRWQAS